MSDSWYGQFGSKDGLRMLVDIEAATTLDERLAALWRNVSRPPAEARDWRPGNDRARARLGGPYRSEFATLAAALEAWASEGLIDLPAPADGVAAVVVSMLIGLEMSWRRCVPWSGPWP